jgi:hypothetical protein
MAAYVKRALVVLDIPGTAKQSKETILLVQ